MEIGSISSPSLCVCVCMQMYGCGRQPAMQWEGGIHLSYCAYNRICQGRVRNSSERWQDTADMQEQLAQMLQGLKQLFSEYFCFTFCEG